LGYRTDGVAFFQRITWQEGREVLSDTDRADTWTAATMRDAEGFVEIQMANIGSEIAGAAEADLRIHIRTVHVNLTTSGVDEIANITDAFLENTVSRRIGDHHGS